MSISLIAQPRNPYAPTTQMNLRYFEVAPAAPGGAPQWWFGGGADLTPYYGFDEDVRHWHATAKAACAPAGADVYPRLKAACDDYFRLPHRGEPRGVGGT
ncbi:MAG: coproporphyrinogen III oxidase, partial [bacterium]